MGLCRSVVTDTVLYIFTTNSVLHSGACTLLVLPFLCISLFVIGGDQALKVLTFQPEGEEFGPSPHPIFSSR